MRYLLLASALLGTAAHAATLKDQFDDPVEVPGDSRVVFFAADMDASKLVKAGFGDADHDLMADAGVLYVADISGMPGLIAGMFAKPKMRKLPYRIALDEDGSLTTDWPRSKGAVTIIEGDRHRFCGDVDCLRAALAADGG